MGRSVWVVPVKGTPVLHSPSTLCHRNMPASPSSTNVGGGGRSPARTGTASPRGATGGGASTTRQRKTASSTAGRSAASTGGMWRFYTDDSPGIKVGPLPVLVGSLVFIATVFMLHIWGKYTRG